MTDYVVITDPDSTRRNAINGVERHFPTSRKIAPNVSIIKDTQLTAQAISELVFERDAEGHASVRHIIVRMGAYWGYHDRDLWDWLDQGND